MTGYGTVEEYEQDERESSYEDYKQEVKDINSLIIREYLEILKLRIKKQMYEYLIWREENQDQPQESFAVVYLTILVKTFKTELDLFINWVIKSIKILNTVRSY